MTDTETAAKPYTDSEATDEAVLLLIRKLRRLHPEVHASLIKRLPGGARTALQLAENRAEQVRDEVNETGRVQARRFLTDAERWGDDDSGEE